MPLYQVIFFSIILSKAIILYFSTLDTYSAKARSIQFLKNNKIPFRCAGAKHTLISGSVNQHFLRYLCTNQNTDLELLN